MANLYFSSRFKSQYKKYKDNKKVKERIKTIFDILINDEPLPKSYLEHTLKGNFKGMKEIHLFPDILVIFEKDEINNSVTFLSIGSHSSLFG